MRGNRLRSQLFRAIGVVVLICVALTIGLGVLLTHRAVERATLEDLGQQADVIAAAQSSGVPSLVPARIKEQLSAENEKVLYDPKDLPAWAQERLADKQPAQGTLRYGVPSAEYYFAARPGNPGTLILLRPQSTTQSLLSPYVWGLLIAAAAGGLLAALAAFLLARRISRPVDRIAGAARTLARGAHPEPVPVEGATEIATLAGAFNDLAEQLRKAQEAERNFLLSVSHELKTPLTAIRGYAEAVEDGVVDPREAAATVAAEARRLERLVRDLLDLARMNRTDFSVHNTEIDLAEVADDAVRRYEQQAESFGVELRAVADGPAPAIADADRVLQIVSNLVENALRLTPPGGEVRVVAAPGVLRVEDTGPGLAETDTERAFERFYLHERYGLERKVGTGLGLAIVKELTHAMGGDVGVESRPGTLTVFTVRLRVPKVVARATLPA
ncbi:MAG TPA: HAMP domain-containing sensor histidine kinase [Gaiellaceae bacterium]|nr:HAMP domain-containing sensor histidine kinase [Gaiellaceae bacterium]